MLTNTVRPQSRLSRFAVGLCLVLIWSSIGVPNETVMAQDTPTNPTVPSDQLDYSLEYTSPYPFLSDEISGDASPYRISYDDTATPDCERDPSPQFVDSEFSIHWVHYWRPYARHVPTVKCGAGPYRMTLSSTDPERGLPEYFRFTAGESNQSQETITFDTLDDLHYYKDVSAAYFYYLGSADGRDEHKRQKFLITVIDAQGLSDTIDLWFTVRKRQPTLKTDPAEINDLNWTVGVPIEELVLEIDQEVGTLCDDRNLFNLPRGITVEEREKRLVFRGTPEVVTDGRQEFVQILKFDCNTANEPHLISEVTLSIEVVEPNRIPKFADEEGVSEDPYTWMRGRNIIDIYRILVDNGDGDLDHIRDEDLPGTIMTSIETGDNCFRDNIVPAGVNEEQINCLWIRGSVPKGDLPERNSDDPYIIEAVDQDGDKGSTKVRVNIPRPLLDVPDLNSRIRWIRGQSNVLSPIAELVNEIGEFPTEIVFVERGDSPTPDWMRITINPTNQDDTQNPCTNFCYTVTISGTPPRGIKTASVILKATRPDCDLPDIDCTNDNLDVFTAQRYKFKFRGSPNNAHYS